MARLIWSPRALADLDAAGDYIAKSSDAYARAFVRRVFAATDSLMAQPYLGAVVPEYELRDLREIQHQSYRILYRLRGDDVEVVAVIHGARQMPRTPPG